MPEIDDLLKFVMGVPWVKTFTCIECERVLDLLDENDIAEWQFGHDCERKESND